MFTAQEDGLRNTPDNVLLDRATALGRVMFSLDTDLLREAKQRQKLNLPFPGVVFARQRKIDIGHCIRDLELIAKAVEPEDLANKVQYLPL